MTATGSSGCSVNDLQGSGENPAVFRAVGIPLDGEMKHRLTPALEDARTVYGLIAPIFEPLRSGWFGDGGIGGPIEVVEKEREVRAMVHPSASISVGSATKPAISRTMTRTNVRRAPLPASEPIPVR